MADLPLDASMMKRIGELKADLAKMTAWGRGLEHDKRLLQEENARLKAEVERLTEIAESFKTMPIIEGQSFNGWKVDEHHRLVSLVESLRAGSIEGAKQFTHKEYIDAMKDDLKRLQARLDHMEATWPRDPHHGGKIYDMPVDPLMREAIDSAKLARKEGGAS